MVLLLTGKISLHNTNLLISCYRFKLAFTPKHRYNLRL